MDYGLDQDELEQLEIVCILGLIGSITCFGVGIVSLIRNKLKLATGLAGFCLFGQLSLHVGLITTYSYTLPTLVASALCAFFGSFFYLIPDKYRPAILGAELGLIACFVSFLFGIILSKFPQYAKHAVVWIGSYFFVSGLMFALLFTSLLTDLLERETFFYIDLMSYLMLIGSLIVFLVRSYSLKDVAMTDQVVKPSMMG